MTEIGFNIGFKGNYFDYVMCLMGSFNNVHPTASGRALYGVERVLVPGGKLFVDVLVAGRDQDAFTGLRCCQ